MDLGITFMMSIEICLSCTLHFRALRCARWPWRGLGKTELRRAAGIARALPLLLILFLTIFEAGDTYVTKSLVRLRSGCAFQYPLLPYVTQLTHVPTQYSLALLKSSHKGTPDVHDRRVGRNKPMTTYIPLVRKSYTFSPFLSILSSYRCSVRCLAELVLHTR
jgi:hypothetical protein